MSKPRNDGSESYSALVRDNIKPREDFCLSYGNIPSLKCGSVDSDQTASPPHT